MVRTANIVGKHEGNIGRMVLADTAQSSAACAQRVHTAQAAQRCKELFDVEALARTLCNEAPSKPVW